MNYVFIVNPVAGNISLDKKIEIIKEICENRGIDYDYLVSEYKGHAKELASNYREKDDHIIFSVGGDGTMNEVLNGLVGTKNMFGIIPLGSGNDFVRTLKTINEKEVLSDVGVINDKYFLNVLCMGIDSFSGYIAEKFKNKKIPRSQIYNAALVYSYFKYKPIPMEFTYNGKTYNDKFMLLAICNGKYYGNGYMVSPQSKIDSGYFDVYYVNETIKPLLLGLIPKMRKGTHLNSRFFKADTSKTLHLKSEQDLICNIDGELLIGREFDISIIERGIKIFNDQEFIDSFSKYKKR